jgi:hypothetical protein
MAKILHLTLMKKWFNLILAGKKMLSGFTEYDKCLTCGMRRYTISMQVSLILNIIAKDIKKKREQLTATDIFKNQGDKKYFNIKIGMKECKELISNPDKYI